MQLMEASQHWSALADSEDAMADHEDSLGKPYGNTDTYRYRSELYRRTAKILSLESETGKPHCLYCMGDHATPDHHKQPD